MFFQIDNVFQYYINPDIWHSKDHRRLLYFSLLEPG